MLFREIIVVVCANYSTHVNVLRGKVQKLFLLQHLIHIVTICFKR